VKTTFLALTLGAGVVPFSGVTGVILGGLTVATVASAEVPEFLKLPFCFFVATLRTLVEYDIMSTNEIN
jgi:hypothetical protein